MSEEKMGSPVRSSSRGVVDGRPQSAAHGNSRGSSRPGTGQAERSVRLGDTDDDMRVIAPDDRGGGRGSAGGGDYSHRPPSGAGGRPTSRGISGFSASANGYRSGSNIEGPQSPGARSNGGSSRGSSPRNGMATRVDSAGVPRYAAATAASNRATTASGLRRYSSNESIDPPQAQTQQEHQRDAGDYAVEEDEVYSMRGGRADRAQGHAKSTDDPYRQQHQQQQGTISAPRAGAYHRSGVDRSVLEGRDNSPPQRRGPDEHSGVRQGMANLAFGGGGNKGAAGKKPKKQVTVPKSPNFSKMSWQRDDRGRRRDGSDPDLAKHYGTTTHASRYNRDNSAGGRNLCERPSMPYSATAQALKSRYGAAADSHHRGGGGIMGPQRTSSAGHRSSSRGRLPLGAQRDQPPPARKIRY
jgi:hypothetical protein